MKTPDEQYWRRKLNAYMHDNPDKALDIKEHWFKALLHSLSDQFQSDDYYDKEADHLAAAADRLPFPKAKWLKAPFNSSKDTPFFHPLGSGDSSMPLPLSFDSKLNPEVAHETASDTRAVLDKGDARAHFICRWRLWRQWACEKDPRFAFLPADTRIPDHTIWNHTSITSALQGCMELDKESDSPALLLFSLGPVQPFIAAARSIRDLWSGSYLISYLMASALSEISHDLGPDHVIFPSLWGQPLADLMMDDIYDEAYINEAELGSVWEGNWRNNIRTRQQFLVPSMPNRFLALVPACDAKAWGIRLEETVREKLLAIGNSVKTYVEANSPGFADEAWQPDRLKDQLGNSLEIAWQSFTVPKTIEHAESIAAAYLPPQEEDNPHSSVSSLRNLRAMWNALPKGHQTNYGMTTGTTAWPCLFALVSWLHDAVKQNRAFDGWKNPVGTAPGRKQNKDSLTGKEEYVLAAPQDPAEAERLSSRLGNPRLFKTNEFVGGLTLVKRLWHLAWLAGDSGHGFQLEDFRMPDLHQLAKGKPFSNDSEEDEDTADGKDGSGSYYAVLALDGDEMGKWISGSKMPKVKAQLSKEGLAYYNENIPAENPKAFTDFLDDNRPLNPSFHLQFSETLANFGIYAVRRIVEAHNGRLIYAGGDDVLALLPAHKALPCARALRAAFQGDTEILNKIRGVWNIDDESPKDLPLFDAQPGRPGTIRLHPETPKLKSEPKGYDLLVPGPAADCSAGIAISHIKSPLQDAVREAGLAEKRAKNEGGRAAFALSLIKRSGETIHWHAKWESGALDIYNKLAEALSSGALSKRFPYRVIELLQPYRLSNNQQHLEDFNTIDIGVMEWSIALDRQCQLKGREKAGLVDVLTTDFRDYLKYIDQNCLEGITQKSAEEKARKRHTAILEGVIGLCQSLAFIERNCSKSKTGNNEPAFRGPGPKLIAR